MASPLSTVNNIFYRTTSLTFHHTKLIVSRRDLYNCEAALVIREIVSKLA